MFEKILVPLDGSQLAEVALPYAEELSGRLGSEITLIYVSDWINDKYERVHQVYMQKTVESVRQAAQAYSPKSENGPIIQVKSVSLVGNPAEEIVKYAEKEGISLIVMSTHGQSGVRRWTLGSVAGKVISATEIPIALIRASGDHTDNLRKKGVLNKVLIPLDGSTEGEVVIPYIEQLASKLKAKIILFQVLATAYSGFTADLYNDTLYSEQELKSNKEIAVDYLNNIGKRLKDKGLAVETEVRFGESAQEIISFAAAKQADFVAMSTHGRTGIGLCLLGSVASRVLYEGNTPLLLVKIPTG